MQNNPSNKVQRNDKEKIQTIECTFYYFIVNSLMDQYFVQFLKNS